MYNGGTHEGGYETKLAQTKGLENKGVRAETEPQKPANKNLITKGRNPKGSC